MISTRARLAAALMVGFLAPLPVYADDFGDDLLAPRVDRDQGRGYVLRDERGRRTGILKQEGANYLIQRDNAGRRTGTVEKDTTGQWIMRDTAGRRVGVIDHQ
ncbi:hypothetical protein [Magnetospirillum sp. 64-120]|uniref:hypothetical protein n=1 Tax=Magnetospirillum sp. 64-120 TaxID=1895778 RepID=UPI000925ED6D|nr:hypothetical protein [Magnetospirillum sp. 64-120]OJX65818.1 MAG: hypothetical protein BGO92_06905 [Magnetospirillum sp. 64-120]